MFRRYDRGTDGAAGEHRLLEELGGAFSDIRAGSADLPDLELASAARVPDTHHPAGRVDPVARIERRQELHRFVGAEESLVPVVAHRELGDEVTDDLQLRGAGHQASAVVSVLAAEPAADVGG